MKPGSNEAMELARGLSSAIALADHERRRADVAEDRLKRQHTATAGRYQTACLILATLAGAAATLAAVLPMVQTWP